MFTCVGSADLEMGLLSAQLGLTPVSIRLQRHKYPLHLMAWLAFTSWTDSLLALASAPGVPSGGHWGHCILSPLQFFLVSSPGPILNSRQSTTCSLRYV